MLLVPFQLLGHCLPVRFRFPRQIAGGPCRVAASERTSLEFRKRSGRRNAPVSLLRVTVGRMCTRRLRQVRNLKREDGDKLCKWHSANSSNLEPRSRKCFGSQNFTYNFSSYGAIRSEASSFSLLQRRSAAKLPSRSVTIRGKLIEPGGKRHSG